MRASAGRPKLTSEERDALLQATHRFVSSVERKSNVSAAELARELLHDGKRGKKDDLSDSELCRNWSVLRETMKHARSLSRRRLLAAMEIAARLYGWADEEGVMTLLDCNREYIERLDAAARLHDEQVKSEAIDRWAVLTRYLMDRYGWADAEFSGRLTPIRAGLIADEALASAAARAKALEVRRVETRE
jgi:hypothetical protein